MDIEQYQPSPQTLVLSEMFCKFFGRQPLYYSFDLGNRVIPVNFINQMGAPRHGGVDTTDYRRIAEQMATSHHVTQLVLVVEETLRCFPTVAYSSDQCCGLIAGLCGGRALHVSAQGIGARAIVTIAGVIWLDKIPQHCLNPDSTEWTVLAKAIQKSRNHILRERELLKNLFR